MTAILDDAHRTQSVWRITMALWMNLMWQSMKVAAYRMDSSPD
jgi:hypothetical protein